MELLRGYLWMLISVHPAELARCLDIYAPGRKSQDFNTEFLVNETK